MQSVPISVRTHIETIDRYRIIKLAKVYYLGEEGIKIYEMAENFENILKGDFSFPFEGIIYKPKIVNV